MFKYFNIVIIVTGPITLRRADVFVWFLKLSITQFCLATDLSCIGWVCYWMCTTNVSYRNSDDKKKKKNLVRFSSSCQKDRH